MNDNEYENLTRLCLVETQMTTEIKRITDERAVVRQQILDNPAVATRAEGSMHVKHENFKVTTTGKLHRRISFSEYEEIKETFSICRGVEARARPEETACTGAG